MAPGSKDGFLSRDPPDIENLLALNPTVRKAAQVKPTISTKKDKLLWKRNISLQECTTARCQTGGQILENDFSDIKHTTLSERAALKEASRFVEDINWSG